MADQKPDKENPEGQEPEGTDPDSSQVEKSYWEKLESTVNGVIDKRIADFRKEQEGRKSRNGGRTTFPDILANVFFPPAKDSAKK